jgi:uncharacterized protein YdhG (YjbR/CyaY superfamily)
MNIEATTIDEYISFQPKDLQVFLEKLRETIKTAAPSAEEVISYKMPAFRYHGMLVYFAAFKNHYSLFPANSKLIIEMKEELKMYKTSKGTIQFAFEKPLPVALIKKIVKARVQENLIKSKKIATK